MDMKVRLLTRWGSRLQGDVTNVSEERAKALEQAGIAKILGVAEAAPQPVKGMTPEEELSHVKEQLVLLGVNFDAQKLTLDNAKKLLKKHNK